MLRTFKVEDNPTLLKNLAATLEELCNAKIIADADAQREAELWLTQNRSAWDVAIIDLFLREGTGLEVLNVCAARKPGQKVVVLSNYATPAIKDACLARGANAVFDKSTQLEEFIDFCSSAKPVHASESRAN